MAHGVEVRFPFLDDRVFAAAAGLPERRKLDGMREKVALREMAAHRLSPRAVQRPKQPYRAPGLAPFVGENAPSWVNELLSPAAIDDGGILDRRRVHTRLR